MILCCIGHSFRYETEKLCRLFLPFEKIEVVDTLFSGENVAVTKLDGSNIFASLNLGGKFYEKTLTLCDGFDDREAERSIAALLFDCFIEITGYAPKWGIVTGIRPARLYSAVIKELGSEEKAKKYFGEKLRRKKVLQIRGKLVLPRG